MWRDEDALPSTRSSISEWYWWRSSTVSIWTDACVRKSISILLTAGSADSLWKMTCRTIRRSVVSGMRGAIGGGGKSGISAVDGKGVKSRTPKSSNVRTFCKESAINVPPADLLLRRIGRSRPAVDRGESQLTTSLPRPTSACPPTFHG